MANLGFMFNSAEVEPSSPYEILPPDNYVVTIVNSEMRANKAGTGEYLWLEMVVEDGPYAGRRVFDRLNLYSNSDKAVQIAKEKLSAIFRAVGVVASDDSEVLHHRRLIAVVNVRPAGPDKTGVHREAQNEVKGFKPVDQVKGSPQQARVAPQPQPQQQTAPVQAASRPATPPWRKQA